MKLMREDACHSTLREAARILTDIIEALDVTPSPDGSVRFAFHADVAMLDRLAVWGAAVEDLEHLKDDDEDDSRDLEKVRFEEMARDVSDSPREVPADLHAEVGELPPLPLPAPTGAPLAA